MLPFPVKIYLSEIFTRATPGSSLVSNKKTNYMALSPGVDFGLYPGRLSISSVMTISEKGIGALLSGVAFSSLSEVN